MNTLRLAVATAALAVLLAACGGTDDADEHASIDPPDCKAHPEQCK